MSMVRRVVRGVGRRLRVAAVEEAGAVVRPRGGRELAPLDAVGQLLAGLDAADPPACANRSRRGSGRARRARRRRRRATDVRAVVPSPLSSFGSNRTRPTASGDVGRPQDVLVLEAGVPELEPAVAAAPRSAGSRVVPQLGQPGPDRRRDPGGGRGRSRSTRSGPRSRPASRANRCPRAAGTDRRRPCRDSRRPGRRSGRRVGQGGRGRHGRAMVGPGPRRRWRGPVSRWLPQQVLTALYSTLKEPNWFRIVEIVVTPKHATPVRIPGSPFPGTGRGDRGALGVALEPLPRADAPLRASVEDVPVCAAGIRDTQRQAVRRSRRAGRHELEVEVRLGLGEDRVRGAFRACGHRDPSDVRGGVR